MMKLGLLLGCALLVASPMTESDAPIEESTSEVVESESESTSTTTEETTETKTEVDEVKEWLGQFFSADKVAMYLSWVAYIGTIIGLVANIKKLKNANQMTLKNVRDEIEKVIGDEVKKDIDAILPKVLKTQESTNDILSIFSKILALSQENTPESRVAILDLISRLGTTGQEVVDNAKEVIAEEQRLIEEHKDEINKKLDEIIGEEKEEESQSYDGTSI